MPSLSLVPTSVVSARYGRPALQALRRAVAAAKRGDALAPVTVVVPTNHVAVAARRALASGDLGSLGTSGAGVAAVTFLTVHGLAEWLGAARLAGQGRRPVSTPVLAAALRRALRDSAGMFAPVAAHPATEIALVAAYGELADLSPAMLDSLAGASPRSRDVVRLCRRARELLRSGWYDESDLADAAVDTVASDAGRLGSELGHLIVHLPQDLARRRARLLEAAAAACPTTVIAGLTGAADADAGVLRSLASLGWHPPPPAPMVGAVATGDATQILTASDADDEVRAAVRAVVNAARDGVPLERMAILFGAREPYGRLVHEHLAAAGVVRNGAAVRPLAASRAGRIALDLLALADHDFRRADVVGLLALAAGGGGGGGHALTAEWQRLSREAGVVAGREQWAGLLARLAADLERRAAAVAAAGSDPFDETGVERRREAAERIEQRAGRVRDLAVAAVGLIDDISQAAAQPRPWREHARWLRRLAGRLLGGDDRRDAWPEHERRAADRVDAALERLATLDGIDQPPALDVFRRTLELELEADLGRLGRFGEGVLVGPLSFAVGLDLDLVIVLGMAEGCLPSAVHDDSLLPDAERRRASGELPLRRDRVGREHRYLLAALAAAERHLLCVPRGDMRASSERVPSRWLVEAASERLGRRVASDELGGLSAGWIDHVPSYAHAVTHASFPATEQDYRLRAYADGHGGDLHDPIVATGAEVIRARRSRDFTRFDGNLAGQAVPSPLDEVVSSTRLESWAACPFAYFVNHLLRVEPVDDPARQLTMSAVDRGALVHEILERFVLDVVARPFGRQPRPDEPWSAVDHELMRHIADQLCDDYESRGLTGRPVFWRAERAQILALADRFLVEDDAERRRSRTRPVAAELRFGYGNEVGAVELPLPDGRILRFRGAADRVDVSDDGTIHVVDYKTGRSDDFRRLGVDNPDEGGTRLQLAIYGLAARQFHGDPTAPVEAHYWFVSDREGFKRIGYPVDDGVLARVGQTLATMVAGIEEGTFPARPDPSGRPWVTCPYCDPDGLGVSELRRAWERKRADPGVVAYAALAEP